MSTTTMPIGSTYSPEVFQGELMPGESVLWMGQPNASVIFHKEDVVLIPFSLMWGGFALFWEAMVLGINFLNHAPKHAPHVMSLFMALWGVPFVVIGQYLIWGRFLTARATKRRTYYGLTNQRVMVLQGGRRRRFTSATLVSIPNIDKSVGKNGIGNITFGPFPAQFATTANSWNSANVAGVPRFIDVENADSVYRMICDAQNHARAGQK
jgi:hypothetical protein